MNKLKKYLDALLAGEGKAIIEKEDVQEVLPRLEAVLDETGCVYSWSGNMEGRVLVIISEVK
ncbi:calcium ABC transporter ATPase [Bacillus thuringiensis]|uniref:Calcium ABC transporter ATPase n=1 Tax=Bacillus thuringiensis subsp. jegathesan TaxID=56955 RepID=A0A9X6M9A5_BACTJ|nr:calcium ABC transporter ATPase [Bacillus thuringiensis]OUB70536.1 calcium ABC transporter ATPase [Bacillus thuringiensis serovar jegathesan]